MANSGFFCMDGYLKRTAKLSDQELGRLFRACMVYHATGEVTDLAGRESVAFDFIREDIDAANSKYADRCEQNRENVKKRWENTNANERIRPNTIVSDGMQDDTKDTYIKEKENIKENIFIDDDNARAIQTDQDDVLNAAEDAGFQRTDAVRAKLISLFEDHGKEKLLEAIDSCVTHGAPNIAYLSAVLKGEPKKTQRPIKTVSAQAYGQRDYSGEQDEAMQRMLNLGGVSIAQ